GQLTRQHESPEFASHHSDAKGPANSSFPAQSSDVSKPQASNKIAKKPLALREWSVTVGRSSV
ncbi:MAG TPA: hypothetical protein VD863_16405, partial [Bradyrhizobium sp.]|nr:hypothetical protein [Bradyrhizobium sp.]